MALRNLLLFLIAVAGCSTSVVPPGEYVLDPAQLPDYESRLDHAGIIEQWSEEFYHRGTALYRTACFSCHGSPDIPGTLPNSRQFWSEPLKFGNDPFSMYQTLTRGRGLMPPQTHLTPQEKYLVIQFVREEFLRSADPETFVETTPEYLAGLPQGDTLGPPPVRRRPWTQMDYGHFLMRTYEVAPASDGPKNINRRGSPIPDEDYRDRNFAYKGIAIRLDPGPGGVAQGQAFALFDHDLMRLAAFWTGEGFIDWEDILLDDQHNIYPRIVGNLELETPMSPGWANPATGDFNDPRFMAVDGRQFGPLPREWTHFKGLYVHGERSVVHYTVGEATVLESYSLESPNTLGRTLNITGVTEPLLLRAAPDTVAVNVLGDASLTQSDGFHLIKIHQDGRYKITYGEGEAGPPEALTLLTTGGPARYEQRLHSPILPGNQEGYAADVFVLPLDNPWNSRVRPTAIDFLSGDEAVVATIDGEVWRLSGIGLSSGEVEWRRIATGLFQPLGIKLHDGRIYVGCRNQIAVLHDLNGDGETDYYESFNNDHQVTEHFHEFAMGLQTDEAGNFYYAKSARHARPSLVPHHGTLIGVSADGMQSRIIANGFRAANGVLLNPDGTFIVTDQEGHWNPMNRVNLVREGGFHGNMYGYGAPADSSDEAMEPPLLWIDQKYDRSPAELLWAPDEGWGPLSGRLLSFSYGYGLIYVVMPQSLSGIQQGGIASLPLPPFPTGIMRGRFNPEDGQLYLVGMSAWATSQMIQTGGLYRIRYTGHDVQMPVDLQVSPGRIAITFGTVLDTTHASRAGHYRVRAWDLKRTRSYGSRRYDERDLPVAGVLANGSTVELTVPDLAPTWVLEITYSLTDADGVPFEGAIQSTVYTLE